ncbi:unnamed protein product [Candidula unifasciata]|uniref:Protein kinase domain-containing protein n=1 Tax=Candidula unifasciata TaxID=100452 RepID=A0A8S3ZR11_9EUPU|nr:unnamed protein product [Candidula unifasciata]
MISLVFCVARPTLAGFVCFLVAICYFEDALCDHLDEDEPPPVFPPKSLESPYPRLLHERDVIHYRDANGQFVTLGSGTFANVTLGELADSGVHVVIKSFTDSPFREILKEIRMHRYAEDLGVTSRLIGLLPSGPFAGNISLVFEYIAYSKDIHDWLHEHKALTTVQWIWVCRQLALALLRLHQHDVMFNDLHRSNILIKKHGNNLQIYFIDFGYATFKSGKIYSGSNFTNLDFLAPELSQGSVTTKATDMFSLAITTDIRIAQLRLTNETVVVKEFYGVSFEKIRNEACMTAFFGEIGISPRIIGILTEYREMTDAAFVQEMWGNGVSLSKFMFVTSEHEWNFEFLQRAAEDIEFQNVCSWNSSEYFLGLIKEKAVQICHAKGYRRRTMEEICTLLIQMMITVHDAGYLINSLRANNVLLKAKYVNSVRFDVDIRLIDLRMISSIHPGIFLNTSPDDIPKFPYLAPEVHRGERTSKSSDIYSLCFALNQIMSEYFVTYASGVTSTKTNQTLNSYLNVYGNSTVQRTNRGHQSKVKSSHTTESVLAVLRYHNLLLKCLHGEPSDRPHLQELLAVSSLAFS